MKKLLSAFVGGTLFMVAHPLVAGWHYGEFKDVEVNIEYFDYAYKLPNGEPVYTIGSQMRYRVTIKNKDNRTFRNFQSKSSMRWADAVSCKRWWYDNKNVSFRKDDPLPGNSHSGLRNVSMGKNSTNSYQVTYFIPLEVCPGRAYTLIEGRHKNNSGRDEVASFKIPLKVQFKRK